MGFVKHVYLYCNGNEPDCLTNNKEACSADGCFEEICYYKQAMKQEGWLFLSGNKAYCPVCRKKLKAVKDL